MIRRVTLLVVGFAYCGSPNLEIRQTTAPGCGGGGGTSTVFSASYSGPSTYGYGSGQLPTVTNLGLKDAAGNNTMSVRWAPNNLAVQNQAEAHVYSRDPDELRLTLAALDNDDNGWARETDRGHSPWVDVLVSPDGRGNLENVSNIHQSHLFGAATPRDQAALPTGNGSIKSVYLYQRGFCSVEQSIEDLLNQVNEGFWPEFRDQVCSEEPFPGGITFVPEMAYADLASWLGQNPPEHYLGGGFHFAAAVTVYNYQSILDSCHIDFNVLYRFGNDDGRLGLIGGNGIFHAQRNTICDSAAPKLSNSLSAKLPKQLHEIAIDQQSFPQPGDESFPLFNNCDPQAKDPCSTHEQSFENVGLTQGMLNARLSSQDQQAVLATARARDGNGKLVNFRCIDRPQPDRNADGQACLRERFRCEYILRAKRVQVLENVVELVWFDDPREFAQPAIPVYYASLARGPEGSNQLCKRRPHVNLLPGPVLYQRSFSFVHGLHRSGCNVYNPPPPPPPKCN